MGHPGHAKMRKLEVGKSAEGFLASPPQAAQNRRVSGAPASLGMTATARFGAISLGTLLFRDAVAIHGQCGAWFRAMSLSHS
jgi:hypothetical protein